MSSNRGQARGALGPASLVAAVVLAAAFQWWTSPLPSPLEPPLESWRAASLSPASPALRWAAPLAGTPFVHGLPPHAWVTAPLPPPVHDGADIWRLIVTALVAGFVAVFALTLRAARCHALAAGAAALTLPLAGVFRGDPFTSMESALSATLLAAGMFGALRFRAGARWPWAAAAIVWLSLAVDNRLSWLPIALPAWVVLDRAGLPRSRRLALAGTMLAALLAASAHSLASAWLTLSATPAGPDQLSGSPGFGVLLRLASLGLTSAGHAMSSSAATASLARAAHGVFGFVGLALIVYGVGRLARRRALLALAVAISSVALLVLALGSSPVEASAAALALLLGGSLGMALGADGLLQATTRQARAGAAVLVVLAAVLPAARFYPAEAWSAGRSLAVSREALVLAVGPRPAFVADLPPIDRAVLPLGRTVRLPADAAVVRGFAAAGYGVHAFERSRHELEAQGLSFAHLPLACPSLDAYLAAMPRGAVVALAASPNSDALPYYSPAAGASAIGVPRRTGAWLTRAVCLVGVAGASSGAIAAVEQASADLRVPANKRVSDRRTILPVTVSLSADPARARVAAERRWYIESRQGLAIAVLDPIGNLWDARVVDETTGFALAPPDSRLAASRLEPAAPACVEVRDGVTTDVTRLARSGALGWSAGTSAGAGLVLYVFGPQGLPPSAASEDRPPEREAFAPRDPALLERMIGDGMPASAGSPLPASRLRVALDGRPAWGTIALGAVPSTVLAIARGTSGAGAARLCAASIGPELLFGNPRQRAAELLTARGRDPWFGAGWYPPEFDGQTPFRWASDQAVLLLRMAPVPALRVTVDATAAIRSVPPAAVSLVVNGRLSGACDLGNDPTRCEWVVGDGAWVEGVNEIALRVSRAARLGTDPRLLGIAVRGVRLERVE